MRYQFKWQDVGGYSQDNQQNLEATIRRAIEVGINHHARGYGTSLRDTAGTDSAHPKRDQLIVRPKSTGEIPESFAISLSSVITNLRLDYVDPLGLHGINNAGNIAPQYPIRWLSGSRTEAASARKSGLSAFPLMGQDIIVQVTNQFDYVNCTGTISIN